MRGFAIVLAACGSSPAYIEPVRPEVAAPAGARAIQIAAHDGRACAVLDIGRVRCWGELGGTVAATPVELAVDRAVQVALFDRHIYVVTKDGGLFGIELVEGLAKPVRISGDVVRLNHSVHGALALHRDGTITFIGGRGFPGAWRYREDRLQRIPDAIDAMGQVWGMCALLRDGRVLCWDENNKTPTPVPGLHDAVAFAGLERELCVRRANGALRCWDGDASTSSDGRVGIVQFVAHTHRCELTDRGAVRCSGSNESGEVGDGTRSAKVEAPVEVTLPRRAKQIAVRLEGTYALLDDGTVVAWGRNEHGELGDGTLVDRVRPAPVPALLAQPLPPANDGRAAVGESSVAMDWSGLPAACKRPERIAAFDDELVVRSAYATIKLEHLHVYLADFNMEPLDGAGRPRGPQRVLLVEFTDLGRPHTWLGTYGAGATQRSWMLMRYGAGKPIYREMASQAASVTHLDATWVCGEAEVPSQGGVATVAFAARMLPSR